MPIATITVTSETKQVRTTVSNESGTFNVPALLPGRYGLKVSLSGFKSIEQVGISDDRGLALSDWAVGNQAVRADIALAAEHAW